MSEGKEILSKTSVKSAVNEWRLYQWRRHRVFGLVCAHLTLPNTLNTQRGLNSANELLAMLVRRLGMLSLLVYMTLQTPVNSKNHSRPFCSTNEHSSLP